MSSHSSPHRSVPCEPQHRPPPGGTGGTTAHGPGLRRLPAAAAALAVATVCAATMIVISTRLPMTWDEGNAIVRSQAVRHWFDSCLAQRTARSTGPSKPHEAGGGRISPFSREAIRTGWPYTTTIEGHPALYGMLIAAGSAVAPERLPPLSRYRLGPVLFFSLAVGALFYRLWRDAAPAAAVIATAALLTLPRLMAHAHFASFDGPLTSAWLLSWAAFLTARRGTSRGVLLWGVLLFGFALGLVLSAKFTGWLAPPAFALGCLLNRDWRGLRVLCLSVPVALSTFLLLNPPLWHQPASGLQTFLSLNLRRAARPEHNITTQFLGRLYNLDYPLPWYNSLFWTAIATPTGTLALAAVGLCCGCKWTSAWGGHAIGTPAADPSGNRLADALSNPAASNHPTTASNHPTTTASNHPGNQPSSTPRAHRAETELDTAPLSRSVSNGVAGNTSFRHSAHRVYDAPQAYDIGSVARMSAAHWLVPVMVRATPWAPPHDGIRLFLPSFAFLALLAGLGGHSIITRKRTRANTTDRTNGPSAAAQTPSSATRWRWPRLAAPRWATVLLAGVFLGNLITLVAYWPQWLSHYNLLVGGLPGAARLGMEPTYYWDSLDAEVLDWIERHTRPSDKLRWAAPSAENLWLMRRWGILRRGFRPADPGNYRYYVIQHRPSTWQPPDCWLIEHAEPVFRKTLRPPGWGFGPWRLDVPLLEIYSQSQYAAALAASHPSAAKPAPLE